MWKGRALQLLGLWLVVSAFAHHTGSNTGWINLVTGVAIVLTSLRLGNVKTWQRWTVYGVGLALFILALPTPLHAHRINIWIDGVAGFLVWFSGWRIVAGEMGGPWRLKDGPVF